MTSTIPNTFDVCLLKMNVGEVRVIRDGKPERLDLSVDAVRAEREAWGEQGKPETAETRR